MNLKVFNILGLEIDTIVEEQQLSGNYSVNFEADNLPTGVYFYKLSQNKTVITKKMLLLR